METKFFKRSDLKAAATLLKAGELVAFPTETVYGLGADASNEAAVKKVYLAKGRPSDNPLIVHIAKAEQVQTYVESLSPKAQQLLAAFWPGSLTLIFNLKPNAFSKSVTGGLKTAAFRLPANQMTRDLINEAGVPLVGPSANTSGKPSPTTAQHVWHDLHGKIAGILDDGPTGVGLESTVLDMTVEPPMILRPGAVTQEAIERIIGRISIDQHLVGQAETPKAPGMKYKHYAPNAQVLLVAPDKWPAVLAWLPNQTDKIGILATDQCLKKITANKTVSKNLLTFSLGNDIISASRRLFDGLRYFDDQPEVKIVLAETYSATGLATAYMNRLQKAAGGKHF